MVYSKETFFNGADLLRLHTQPIRKNINQIEIRKDDLLKLVMDKFPEIQKYIAEFYIKSRHEKGNGELIIFTRPSIAFGYYTIDELKLQKKNSKGALRRSIENSIRIAETDFDDIIPFGILDTDGCFYFYAYHRKSDEILSFDVLYYTKKVKVFKEAQDLIMKNLKIDGFIKLDSAMRETYGLGCFRIIIGGESDWKGMDLKWNPISYYQMLSKKVKQKNEQQRTSEILLYLEKSLQENVFLYEVQDTEGEIYNFIFDGS